MNLLNELRAADRDRAVRPRPEEIQRRRSICMTCDERIPVAHGRLRCRLCSCGEPARNRPFCPAKLWGIEAFEAMRAKYEAADGEVSPLDQEDEEAAAYAGQIVYIMPCLNEGKWVRRTIRDLRRQKAPETDLRFCVIDDGSTDGSCDGLDAARDTVVVRNAEPCGQAKGRAVGVYLFPDASAYISIDPHEALETQYGAERLAMAAAETGGIVGAVAKKLGVKSDAAGAGARWACQMAARGERVSPILKTSWLGPGEARLQSCDLHGGAYYCFTRETFERLGGFVESQGRYGFFERGLAVQARFKGVPSFVHTGVSVRHLYRTKKTGPAAAYKRSGEHVWYSYIECFRTMFRPEIWERVFRPALEGVRFDAHMHYLLNAEAIEARRIAFEGAKAVKDEDVVRWMGLGWMLRNGPEPGLTALGAHVWIDARILPDAPRAMIVGEDDSALARELAKLRPGASTAIVEADPDNAAAAEAVLPPGARVVRAALADRDRPTKLFRRAKSTAHSLIPTPAGTRQKPAGEIEVEGARLGTLLKRLGWDGLDVLILNCEGGELAACRQLESTPVAGQVCVSFHSRPKVELYPEAKRDAAISRLLPLYEAISIRPETELYLLVRRDIA